MLKTLRSLRLCGELLQRTQLQIPGKCSAAYGRLGGGGGGGFSSPGGGGGCSPPGGDGGCSPPEGGAGVGEAAGGTVGRTIRVGAGVGVGVGGRGVEVGRRVTWVGSKAAVAVGVC